MKTITLSLATALGLAMGTAAAAPALSQAPLLIAAKDVRAHVGQTVAIEAPVSDVHHARSGKEVMINLGGTYPNNALTAVVFKDDLAKFSNIDTLKGKAVRVTGTVKLYRGMPEIVLSDPGQLKMKDGA